MTTETRNYSVYIHTSPSGKRYVGITSQKPERRWRSGEAYKTNRYFYNAIHKYGWDNIHHEIVSTNLTEQEAKTLEISLIAKHNTTNPDNGYNQTVGGDGITGYKFTNEQRIKRSEKMSGKQNALGYTFTDEQLAYHIDVRRAYEFRENASIKQSKYLLNNEQASTRLKRWESENPELVQERQRKSTETNRTEERRAAASEKSKGNMNAKRVPVVQMTLSGEVIKIWRSTAEAAKELKLISSSITSVCRGKRTKTGGFRWMYAEDYYAQTA